MKQPPVETAKEDARRLAQRKLWAGYEWTLFEDAWRALADDRKVLSLRHRRRSQRVFDEPTRHAKLTARG
jgi:hypothetical protein